MPRRARLNWEVGVLSGAAIVTLAVFLFPWYRIEVDYGEFGGVHRSEFRGTDGGLLGAYELVACWVASAMAYLRSRKRTRTTAYRWSALLLCAAALALCVVDIRDFSYSNWLFGSTYSREVGPYVEAGGALVGMVSAVALLGTPAAAPEDDRSAELRRVFE